MVVPRSFRVLSLVLTFAEAMSTNREAGSLQTASSHKRLALDEEASNLMRAGSVSQSLAGFQKFTNDLVDEYKRTGMPMDNETAAAINTVINYINEMYPRLKEWDRQDRERLTNCSSNKTFWCDEYMTPAQVSQIWQFGNQTELNRAIHRECRFNQSQQQNESNDRCKDYDDYRTGVANYSAPYFGNIGFPRLPSCVSSEDIPAQQGHLQNGYINTMAEATLATMEDCLEQFKMWFDPLHQRFLQCGHRLGNGGESSTCPDPNDPANPPTCKTEQNAFEESHCSWQEKYRSHCDGWRICNASIPMDHCSVLCNGELQINANARRAENETGERIICLLDVLVNSTNDKKPEDLQTCKNKTYNTSEFIIDCNGTLDPPHPPPPIDCDPMKNEPVACSVDFLFKEYRPPTQPTFMELTPFCGCKKCALVSGGVEAPQYVENETTGCRDLCPDCLVLPPDVPGNCQPQTTMATTTTAHGGDFDTTGQATTTTGHGGDFDTTTTGHGGDFDTTGQATTTTGHGGDFDDITTTSHGGDFDDITTTGDFEDGHGSDFD